MINLALDICKESFNIIKEDRDYENKNSNKDFIDYKKLSFNIQRIKRIDFINDNLDKINSILYEIYGYLNNDKYNSQLEQVINDKRRG